MRRLQKAADPSPIFLHHTQLLCEPPPPRAKPLNRFSPFFVCESASLSLSRVKQEKKIHNAQKSKIVRVSATASFAIMAFVYFTFVSAKVDFVIAWCATWRIVTFCCMGT
jgi:hypothetical protein